MLRGWLGEILLNLPTKRAKSEMQHCRATFPVEIARAADATDRVVDLDPSRRKVCAKTTTMKPIQSRANGGGHEETVIGPPVQMSYIPS